MKIERVVFSSTVSLPGVESGRGLSQTDHGVIMEYKDGMLRVHGAPPQLDGRMVSYMIPVGNILMMESEDAYKIRVKEEEGSQERSGVQSTAKSTSGADAVQKQGKAKKAGGAKAKG